MDMDFEDEQNGRMEEIHKQLPVAYCQFTVTSQDFCKSGHTLLHEAEKIEKDSQNIALRLLTIPLNLYTFVFVYHLFLSYFHLLLFQKMFRASWLDTRSRKIGISRS